MSTEGTQETKICDTCQRPIPILSYTPHTLYCARHTVICELCKEPFNKNEIATHKDTVHKRVSCDNCEEQMEQQLLADHTANSCSHRPVPCSYCEVNVQHFKLPEHEDKCGNRTEKCEKCHRFIKIKDALRHESTACQYPPLPPPVVTSSSDTRKHQTSTGLGPSTTTMKGSGLLRLPAYRGEPSGDLWEFQQGPPRPPSRSTAMPVPPRSTGVRVVETDDMMDIHPSPPSTRSTKRDDDRVLSDYELAKRLEEEEMDQIARDRLLAMQLEKEDGPTGWSAPPPEIIPRVPSFTVRRDHDPVRKSSPERHVPCSYCNQTMPEHRLLDHESMCKFSNPAYEAPGYSFGEDERQECTYCRNMFRVTELPLHVANCSFNYSELSYTEPIPPRGSNFDESFPAQSRPDEDEVLLPCEFCTELFPREEFTEHEEKCLQRFENPASAQTGIWST